MQKLISRHWTNLRRFQNFGFSSTFSIFIKELFLFIFIRQKWFHVNFKRNSIITNIVKRKGTNVIKHKLTWEFKRKPKLASLSTLYKYSRHLFQKFRHFVANWPALIANTDNSNSGKINCSNFCIFLFSLFLID